MWTSQKLKDGKDAHFGIGWIVEPYQGRTLAGHSGGPALSDIWHIVEDQFTIIVLTNQRNLAPELVHGIADMYYPQTKTVGRTAKK